MIINTHTHTNLPPKIRTRVSESKRKFYFVLFFLYITLLYIVLYWEINNAIWNTRLVTPRCAFVDSTGNLFTYLPDFVMTISVPILWNSFHKFLDSSVTFGSSSSPSSGCRLFEERWWTGWCCRPRAACSPASEAACSERGSDREAASGKGSAGKNEGWAEARKAVKGKAPGRLVWKGW